jgi:hypothetical protein
LIKNERKIRHGNLGQGAKTRSIGSGKESKNHESDCHGGQWCSFYLKDLILIGCTAWDAPISPNLISYIERSQLRPLLAKIFPLEGIEDAQREFLKKTHVGNFVLIPPPVPIDSEGDPGEKETT